MLDYNKFRFRYFNQNMKNYWMFDKKICCYRFIWTRAEKIWNLSWLCCFPEKLWTKMELWQQYVERINMFYSTNIKTISCSNYNCWVNIINWLCPVHGSFLYIHFCRIISFSHEKYCSLSKKQMKITYFLWLCYWKI